VHRGGHALHTALASELLRQREAWEFSESTAAERVTVAAGARVAAH
jgi:UDP-3-O-acyl-N-acetylglucosamine deacetylase